ncbi:YkvA family protein [Sphingomonas sp. SUN019]|uniref:YkvA family protein n=1 Tax=Sphingomonas sp. SUN019 TaxID=2937788 RepID=UPI002164959D|nr:YkvA family protein [Sphingomonas sp. SUN019]UVO49506.1 YkvA family protein [Sphingomonas sp. SUN019]
MTTRVDRFRAWVKALKTEVVAVWIASRSPRTPLVAKVIAGAVAAYALSPIDLIPDFIPVLGYLDDLIIVPLGIAIVVRLIPADLMDNFRAQAMVRPDRPTSRVAAAFVITVWVVVSTALSVWLWRLYVYR